MQITIKMFRFEYKWSGSFSCFVFERVFKTSKAV